MKLLSSDLDRLELDNSSDCSFHDYTYFLDAFHGFQPNIDLHIAHQDNFFSATDSGQEDSLSSRACKFRDYSGSSKASDCNSPEACRFSVNSGLIEAYELKDKSKLRKAPRHEIGGLHGRPSDHFIKSSRRKHYIDMQENLYKKKGYQTFTSFLNPDDLDKNFNQDRVNFRDNFSFVNTDRQSRYFLNDVPATKSMKNVKNYLHSQEMKNEKIPEQEFGNDKKSCNKTFRNLNIWNVRTGENRLDENQNTSTDDSEDESVSDKKSDSSVNSLPVTYIC